MGAGREHAEGSIRDGESVIARRECLGKYVGDILTPRQFKIEENGLPQYVLVEGQIGHVLNIGEGERL